MTGRDIEACLAIHGLDDRKEELLVGDGRHGYVVLRILVDRMLWLLVLNEKKNFETVGEWRSNRRERNEIFFSSELEQAATSR